MKLWARPGYYGSAEVVGFTPGPDFVPPVMALESLPVEPQQESVDVVMEYVPFHGAVQTDLTEEEAARHMEWEHLHHMPEFYSNYFMWEVST